VRADSAQDTWCQVYFNLGYVHFGSTIYCLTFRRHLSEKHPLYDMMKFHCEGTVPQTTLSIGTLTDTTSVASFIFGINTTEMFKFAGKGATAFKYEKFSYNGMIKVIN